MQTPGRACVRLMCSPAKETQARAQEQTKLDLMIEMDKSAAQREPSTPEDGAAANAPTLHIPQLELQPGAGRRHADHYQLDELLCYHDRAFIAQAHAALCQRAPTAEELSCTLNDLRSGRRSKIEIIEGLLATRADGPAIQVGGLPSPIWRRVSRWPVVGYVLRTFHVLVRLPVLIRHQQQFEAYSMAQQQHIVDYLNDVLAPAVSHHAEGWPGPHLVRLADAIESIMMLSDSLVELSGRHAGLQAQFQDLLAQVQDLQIQREGSETQLHANLVTLTEAQTELQQRLDELCRAQDETAAWQREFLVQEQRVIVETQKVALGELQDQLRELASEQEKKRAMLATEVRRLHVLIEGPRSDAPAGPGAQEPELA